MTIEQKTELLSRLEAGVLGSAAEFFAGGLRANTPKRTPKPKGVTSRARVTNRYFATNVNRFVLMDRAERRKAEIAREIQQILYLRDHPKDPEPFVAQVYDESFKRGLYSTKSTKSAIKRQKVIDDKKSAKAVRDRLSRMARKNGGVE